MDHTTEKHAKVYAIVNQKGGVAKTTTAINLASYLGIYGKSVLLLDLDPQGNATSGFGLDKSLLEETIYHVLVEDFSIKNTICLTSEPNVNIVPASLDLAAAEMEMLNLISRETRLKQAIRPVIPMYDIVLIDCPPSLGVLTINALTAADGVLIPVQSEYYALEGLGQLMKTVKLVENSLNPDLQLTGAVLTMFDTRTNLSREVRDDLISYLGDKVFDIVIPRNVDLSEAPSFGQSIQRYSPNCKGAEAYKALAEEFLKVTEVS